MPHWEHFHLLRGYSTRAMLRPLNQPPLKPAPEQSENKKFRCTDMKRWWRSLCYKAAVSFGDGANHEKQHLSLLPSVHGTKVSPGANMDCLKVSFKRQRGRKKKKKGQWSTAMVLQKKRKNLRCCIWAGSEVHWKPGEWPCPEGGGHWYESSWRLAISSISQGSILGPIMFNIIINYVDDVPSASLLMLQNWKEWLIHQQSCCHPEWPGQVVKMCCQEQYEVRQGEGEGPALGEEQPQAAGHTRGYPAGKKPGRKGPGSPGGHQVEHVQWRTMKTIPGP